MNNTEMKKYIYRVGKELPFGLERTVLRLVSERIGKENAISRGYVHQVVLEKHNIDIDARTLRKTLEVIRSKGIRICDLEDGSGLFIARTEEEYQAFRARYGAHAFTQLKVIKAMDNQAQITAKEDVSNIKPQAVQMGFGV